MSLIPSHQLSSGTPHSAHTTHTSPATPYVGTRRKRSAQEGACLNASCAGASCSPQTFKNPSILDHYPAPPLHMIGWIHNHHPTCAPPHVYFYHSGHTPYHHMLDNPHKQTSQFSDIKKHKISFTRDTATQTLYFVEPLMCANSSPLTFPVPHHVRRNNRPCAH